MVKKNCEKYPVLNLNNPSKYFVLSIYVIRNSSGAHSGSAPGVR